MKNFLFIVLISLFSLNVFSQGLNFKQKINVDDLIGYWKPSEESSQLFFWKDVNGKLQVQEICETTGEPVDLIRLRIDEDSVLMDTIFKPNEWVIRSVFVFTSSTELVRSITGDTEAIVHYTKIK
jgi:hypothetical protein